MPRDRRRLPIALYWLLLPLLSLDSFTIAVSLASLDRRRRVFWMLTSAEALAPLLGLLVGEATGRLVPRRWFSAAAALLLLALGVLLLREAFDDAAASEILERTPLLGALAVGADEFGFGLTLPFLHAYAALPALIIALQAPLAVGFGLWLGDRGRGLLWLRWVPSAGVLLLALAAVLSAAGLHIPLGAGIVKMIGKA